VAEWQRRFGAEHLAREDAQLSGSSCLVRPSNGPAWMLRTVMPSLACTTGSIREVVARVKMSTSMPAAARRRDSSRM